MQLGIRDGVVAEIAFTGRGCAISQASASLLTDEIMGMPVEKAEAFRADDLLELLGIDISPARLKCAMLSLETLEHALAETPGASDAALDAALDAAPVEAAASTEPANS
jgi:nitrogen fixation NifU-like protein